MTHINYFHHSLYEDEIERSFTYDNEQNTSTADLNDLNALNNRLISGSYPTKNDQPAKLSKLNPNTFRARLSKLSSLKNRNRSSQYDTSSSRYDSSKNSNSSNSSTSSNSPNISNNLNSLSGPNSPNVPNALNSSTSSPNLSSNFNSISNQTFNSNINLSIGLNNSNNLKDFNDSSRQHSYNGSNKSSNKLFTRSSIDKSNLDDKVTQIADIHSGKKYPNENKSNLYSQTNKTDKINQSANELTNLDLYKSPTTNLSKRSTDHLERSPYLPPKKRWASTWQNSQTTANETIDLSSQTSSSANSSPKLITTSTNDDVICTNDMNSNSSYKASKLLSEMFTPKLTSKLTPTLVIKQNPTRSPSITSSTSLDESNSFRRTDRAILKTITNEAAPLQNARESSDDKTKSTSNQLDIKKIFNYFKAPEVSKITVDERMQDNIGYKILVEEYSDLFEEFQHFNEVQIRLISPIFESNNSLVVKSPTGSGKTTIFEFAIVKVLNELKSPDFKVILIEPMKAICNERYNAWKKFAKYGLNVYNLTGDSKFESENVDKSSIIICTPEKIELLTRSYKELELITKNLKLVLIDEVHVMGDNKRGYILEGFICRLKMNKLLNCDQNSTLRFISASATIGDLDNLCDFFGKDTLKIRFGEETRNVPLDRIVLGYECSENVNEFIFDNKLTDCLINVLNKYQKGRQVLIFCPTRKIVKKTADYLKRGNYKRFVRDVHEMIETSRKINEKDLRECLETGVAYHHSGLSLKDKELVEKAYRSNLISILVCTTSLAMGVNLPANVVIIKGTFRYIQSNFVQFTETEINQMIGRAGRQMNSSLTDQQQNATAIIMTKNCHKHLYDKMLSDKPLESRLLENLCEFINSEIILENLKSFNDVVAYIKSTYMYLRLNSNPEYYNLSKNANIEQAIKNWAKRILKDLHYHKAIKFNEDESIQKDEIGLIMAENSISFETIKRFNTIEDLAINSLLIRLCEFKELTQQTTLRNDDKQQLNELNKGTNLRFPIRNKSTNRISDVSSKVNCIIQAELGCLLNNNDQSHQRFILEANFLIKIAKKLAKGMVEFLSLKTDKQFSTFKNAVLLSKSLNAGIWDNSSKQITKQIPKIGHVLSTKLDEAGFTTFHKLREAKAYEIEQICGRNMPFGDEFVNFVEKVPHFKLKVDQIQISSGFLKADLNIRIDLKNYYKQPEGNAWLVVGDEEDNLLFSKKLTMQMFKNLDHSIEFQFKVNKVRSGLLFFHIINETIVGSDCLVKMTPKYVDVISKKDDLTKEDILNL